MAALNTTDATGKLVFWLLHLFEFCFESVLQAEAKQQQMDYPACPSPPENDVPILTMSDTEPENKNTKTEALIWNNLSYNKYAYAVLPGIPEASRVLDGTNKGLLCTTSKFLTKLASSLISRKFPVL